MHVTLVIPDDLAARLGSAAEVERRALEALMVALYGEGRLSRDELERILGIADDAELDRIIARSDPRSAPQPAEDLVARFKAFASDHTLDGLNVRDLIDEGRR